MSGPPEDPSAPDDPPAVDDPSAVDADEPARWVLLAGLGVLMLALLVVVLVTSLRTTSGPGEEALVASALSTSEPSSPETLEPAASEGSPVPSATPSAAAGSEPGVGASPTVPSEDAGGGDRLPDEADAAAFLASFQPTAAEQSDSLVVDLDEDGVDEVVVASVAERTSRVDVARWDGQRYRVVFTGRGGAAEEITDLRAVDVAGDEAREVWVTERTGDSGGSVSMWGVDAAGMTPLRASGGCADGRHTYGVVGAEVRPGEIRATCDGGPLPPEVWPVDVYSWQAGGWTWTTRIGSAATPAA